MANNETLVLWLEQDFVAVARANVSRMVEVYLEFDLQAKEDCGSILTGYVKSYKSAHCSRRKHFPQPGKLTGGLSHPVSDTTNLPTSGSKRTPTPPGCMAPNLERSYTIESIMTQRSPCLLCYMTIHARHSVSS